MQQLLLCASQEASSEQIAAWMSALSEKYPPEKIIEALGKMRYTTKMDFGKRLCLADFVEAIEPRESDKLYTYQEMLAWCQTNAKGGTYEQFFTPVYIDGEAKPKWRKL